MSVENECESYGPLLASFAVFLEAVSHKEVNYAYFIGIKSLICLKIRNYFYRKFVKIAKTPACFRRLGARPQLSYLSTA